MITLAVVAALALSGGVAAFLLLRGSTVDLLERVPADADVAAVVYLDPSAGQKVNLARLLEAFPGLRGDLGGADDLDSRIETLGDDLLADARLKTDDVRSWLGVEVAIVVDVVDDEVRGALIADVADEEGARRMLAKLGAPGAPWDGITWTERDYEGAILHIPDRDAAAAYAFDGDALVFASDEGFLENVIDTTRGTLQHIGTTPSFQEAEAALPDGRLFIAYVNAEALVDAVSDQLAPLGAGSVTSLSGLGDLEGVRGVALSIAAEPHGIAVDVVAAYDPAVLSGPLREQAIAPDRENELVSMVPGDAWGVYAVQHVDLAIDAFAEELQAQEPGAAGELDALGLTGPGGFLEHVTGDLAIEMAPGDAIGVGGALLVGVDDDAAARDALDILMIRIVPGTADVSVTASGRVRDRERHADWRDEEYQGTTITYAAASEIPIAYAVRDGVAVIGTTPEQVAAVLDAASTDEGLVETPTFIRGIEGVPAADGLLFVDMGRVVASIRDLMSSEERAEFDEEVAPDLGAIRSVAMGLDVDEEGQRTRLFVAIGAPEPQKA